MYERWADVPSDLKTKTQWNEWGRRLKRDAHPSDIFDGRYGTYDLYRESETEEKLWRCEVEPVSLPATQANVLAAIFAVNRSAKRFRDAASSCYEKEAHVFAHVAKKKKEKLYELKDKGIVYAHQAGWISPESIHGGLCLYRGGGYSFHSTLKPSGFEPQSSADSQPISVEAKPREAGELRLKDACFLLESLSVDLGTYQRLCVPRRNRFIEEYDRDDEAYDYDYEEEEWAS